MSIYHHRAIQEYAYDKLEVLREEARLQRLFRLREQARQRLTMRWWNWQDGTTRDLNA